MWSLEFATRLLGRTPKHTIGFIRSMTLPMMLIIMILGLISGLAGETELISEYVGVSTRLLVLEEGETAFSKSTMDESVIGTLEHPKIRQILPQRLGQATIQSVNNAISAETLGVNYTAFLEFYAYIAHVEGIVPTENEEADALIGSELAKQLPQVRNSLPATIVISRMDTTEQFNVSVTGIVWGRGHYMDDLILSPAMFITLFPERAGKLSLVELQMGDTTEVDKTIETLERQAREEGYHIQVISEQSQAQIANRIMSDIIVIFWAFGIFAFFIVGVQTYFAVKWIALHYRAEFATLRCLGTSKRTIASILLFCAMLLGNIALLLALIIGVLSATALLAVATTFTQTTRFYATLDLPGMVIVMVLANLAVILGSVRQIREIGRKTLATEANVMISS